MMNEPDIRDMVLNRIEAIDANVYHRAVAEVQLALLRAEKAQAQAPDDEE